MPITPQSHGTGLVRQPIDTRDFQMADVLPGLGTPARTLPPTGNTSKWSKVRRNQWNTNRCQSFSTHKLMEMQRNKQGLPSIDPCIDLTYYKAREYDSRVAGTGGVVSGDNGASNRSAKMSMQKDGLLGTPHKGKNGKWVGWPNGVQTMNIDPMQWWKDNVHPWTQPPIMLLGQWEVDEDPQISSHHHQATTARAVTGNDGMGLLLAVKGSIDAGFPVDGGIPARDSLYSVSASGHGIMTIPQATEHLYGYHSIAWEDYDDTMHVDGHIGYLHVENSWGEEWGVDGFGWMPYDWFLDPTCCPFDMWAIHWAQ